MTDYKIFQNPLKASPDDWDVLLTIALPNYAMLDQLEAKRPLSIASTMVRRKHRRQREKSEVSCAK